jgi:uncharacterized protein (DUF2267 family)
MATGTPIAGGTIEQLAAAIAQAINQSGGAGRNYNPITNQASKQDDPAARVAAIRTHKTAISANELMKELAEVQRKSIRSSQDLERMLDFNRKTLGQALNKYETFAEAQKEMVKELNKQLSSGSVPASVKALAGSIDTLEDVLKFSDAAKAAAELSKAMKDSQKTGENMATLAETISDLKKALPAGKSLADVDASLDALDKRMQSFLTAFNAQQQADGSYKYHDAAGAERSQADQDKINKALQAIVQKSQVAKNAAKAAEDLAINGHTAVIEANVRSMKRLDGVVAEAGRRVSAWGVKVTSAAWAIDKLADAAVHLYQSLKTAAATGTERSLGGVAGREMTALTTMISSETIQEGQKNYAQRRNIAGREDYDKSQRQGTFDFFKLTGDLDEAHRQFGLTNELIGRHGVSFQTAMKSTRMLMGTFNELTMMTGMTVGEINAMNQELASGNDYRQTLAGLNEKERAMALVGLDLMVKENAIRGISIQQTKEMLKATQAESNPFSPKSRMKAAAKLRLLGASQGLDVESAARVIDAGGIAQRRAELSQSGMSPQAIEAEMNKVQRQEQSLGTKNSKDMGGRVTAQGLAIEAIGGKMPELKSYFDGTRDVSAIEGNQMLGKAADEFNVGVNKFVAGVGLMGVNGAKNTASNPYVQAIIAGAGYLLFRKMGGPGIAKLLPGISGLLKKVLPGAKGAAAGATGAAGALSGARTASGAAAVVRSSSGALMNTVRAIIPVLGAKAATAAAAIPAAASSARTMAAAAVAASAAARPIIPKIPTQVGMGSKALGVLGKLATPLAVLGTGLSIYGHATSDETAKEKTEAISGDVGGLAGGLAGAGYGAAIGTAIFPGVGTAVGGILGGLIGMWAGDKVGTGVGMGINATGVNDPSQPGVTGPSVNTPSDQTQSTAVVDANGNVTGYVTPDAPQAVDPSIMLTQAVTQMNITLGSIHTLLAASAGEMSGSSEAALEQQKRLARALKNAGMGSVAPASTAYNA